RRRIGSLMSHRIRIFVLPAIATGLLMPVAWAQKPPAPAPAPPPTTTPGRPTTANPAGSRPGQPRADLVIFPRGGAESHDGASIPHDMLLAGLCNNRVRQQVYASPHGDFSMQL